MKNVKLKSLSLLIVIFAFSYICSVANGQTQIAVNSFKVKVKSQNSRAFAMASANLKSTTGTVQTGIQSFDRLNKQFGARKMTRLFKEAGKFEQKHIAHGLDQWYVVNVDLKNEGEMQECINNYQSDPNIELAEPFNKTELIKPLNESPIQQKSATITNSSFPNDPEFQQQWHYENSGQNGGIPGIDIDLKRGWAIGTGDTSVIVAVIDGGIDASHPDLAASMWTNNAEKNGLPNVDDDHNGYVDDVHGYNFEQKQSIITPNDHGTHVAGTIAGVTNNGVGISGIAGGDGTGNGARLMTCDVFGAESLFESKSGGFENAFVYAADNGAVIAQNSWGNKRAGNFDQSILDAINYFIDNAGYDEKNNPVGPMQGGVVIFAAGNSSSNQAYYPAYYHRVLAVAATDRNDRKAEFSNYGDWVDVAASGVEVYSTITNGGYKWMSGTSMACPHVSGLAALIVSHFKGKAITPEMVWDRIINFTDNINEQNPKYVNQLGQGRINVFSTFQEADTIPPAPILDLAFTASGQQTIDIAWTSPGSSGKEGTASRYDLRYSLKPINNENFNNATKYLLMKRPAISGFHDSFRLTDLIPDTTFYLAIKSVDAFSNHSEMSNLISIRTLTAPGIQLSKQELSQKMKANEKITTSVTVSNTGKDILIFDVNYHNAMPLSYGKSGNVNMQINDESSVLFSIDTKSQSIVRLNCKTGEVLSKIPVPYKIDQGDPFGLAFDGRYFYMNNPNIPLSDTLKYIYMVNQLGKIVDSVAVRKATIICGLGVSNGKLYVVDNWSSQVHEIDLKTKKLIRYIDHDFAYPWGMTGASKRNSIFISRDGINEISLETGKSIRKFLAPTNYMSLAYSNSSNLLFALYSNSGSNIDDGKRKMDVIDPDSGKILYSFICSDIHGLAGDESGFDQKWLTVMNIADTLSPGKAITFDVQFNTDSLQAGIYTDFIPVRSNDPAHLEMKIPVVLEITEVKSTNSKVISKVDPFNVYPNPASDVLFIDIKEKRADLFLYNTQGILVKQIVAEYGATTLDLKNLPKGIYLLKLKSSEISSERKIIKQ